MEDERAATEEGKEIEESHEFMCPKCGAVMYPRKYEVEEGVHVWGIFDQCYKSDEKLVFDTLQEAIDNYLNA